jgi:2-hydroxy-3-keto-5-methylthiopentenyl-1-phosphate phosphatase
MWVNLKQSHFLSISGGMFFFLNRIFACRKGRHERDKRRVRHNGDTFAAPCRHCGVRLIKNNLGHWVEGPTATSA